MSKATILLIDNDDFLETGTAFLQDQGYQVITARNLYEAKKKLGSEKIDLAVIDIGLADDEIAREQFVMVMTKEFPVTLPRIFLTDSHRNRILRHIFYYQSQDTQLITETVIKTKGFSVLLTSIEELLKPPPAGSDSARKDRGFVFNEPVVARQETFVWGEVRDLNEPRMHGGTPSGAVPDEVAFTAYHPKEGKVDTWHTLLVYTHILSALDQVRNDAKKFEAEIKGPKETTSPSTARLVRGTEITIVPSCEGVIFNPGRLSLKWIEDFHRVEFRFNAGKSLSGDAAKGQITVYVGPLIIGTLKFAMLFGESDPSLILEQEVQSRMYQKDAIFISYSHKDTDVVLAFKKVHEATGHDVLIDIDDLRSGQEWNPELMRMIDHADIFQLFWSENSCQSRYCKQEWLHALKRNEEGFIRPVYWHLPLPEPPEELSKYHFEYVEL